MTVIILYINTTAANAFRSSCASFMRVFRIWYIFIMIYSGDRNDIRHNPDIIYIWRNICMEYALHMLSTYTHTCLMSTLEYSNARYICLPIKSSKQQEWDRAARAHIWTYIYILYICTYLVCRKLCGGIRQYDECPKLNWICIDI